MKKSAKLKSKLAGDASDHSLKSTAKMVMEQAEQIWLAGLGAFAKAQEQSGKLYETLIKEGSALEKLTRKATGARMDEMRGAVETTVTQVRERATDAWDKLEQVFEDRVSRVLGRLGIPGREEIETLSKRVDDLSRAVRALDAGTRAKAASKAPEAKKAPAKAAAAPKKAAVKAAPAKAAPVKAAATKKPAAPKAAAPKAVKAKKAAPAVSKAEAPATESSEA